MTLPPPPVADVARTDSAVGRFAELLLGISSILLAVRIGILLLGLQTVEPRLDALIALTEPFAAPLEGIVRQPTTDAGVVPIDLGALLAIGVLQVLRLAVRPTARLVGTVTRPRGTRILLGAAVLAGLAADAFAPELFDSVLILGALLLAGFLIRRPSRVRRGAGWLRRRRRLGGATIALAVATFALVAVGSDQVRHPSIDAATEAALWDDANAALNEVAAADLAWQHAPVGTRSSALTPVRAAVRHFADAVDLLGRVRPPEGGQAAHLAVAAVYRDLADALGGLPDALADGNLNAAAAIWERASTLGDEATSFLRLTSETFELPTVVVPAPSISVAAPTPRPVLLQADQVILPPEEFPLAGYAVSQDGADGITGWSRSFSSTSGSYTEIDVDVIVLSPSSSGAARVAAEPCDRSWDPPVPSAREVTASVVGDGAKACEYHFEGTKADWQEYITATRNALVVVSGQSRRASITNAQAMAQLVEIARLQIAIIARVAPR